jgi:outer membrane usher protein
MRALRSSRGVARRSVLVLALAVVLALPAQAQPGDETLLLDLCVNDRCVGVAAVIARGDDVLVDREALAAANIDTGAVAPEHIGERDFVSLRALNHDSRFAIDRTQLRLDLRLSAELLPRQRAQLNARTVAETAAQPWTAFVNYAATVGQQRERSLFLDAAIGRGNGALRSTALWDQGEGWRRGLTRFELDQPASLRRWTIGDQYAIPRDPLGGGLLLGGFGVERAFDQDPYLVTFPQPTYSGVLESPGTVEVYANGVLVGRRELDAGPFTLEQLGIQPGRNDVRVIVRDPFGNRSELASRSYYGSTAGLLARGLSEYAVRAGAPRVGGGLGDRYADDHVLQAWYRRGISDALTLGARVEGDRSLRNAGIDLALRLPAGQVALALADSEADGVGRGSAWSLNYGYSTRNWGFGLGTRRASARYRNLGDPVAALLGPLRIDDYAAVSFSPRERLSLQLNAGRRQRDGGDLQRSAGMSGTLQLWPRAQLLVTVQRNTYAGVHDTSAQLSLGIALDRDSLTFSTQRREAADASRNGYGFDARRSRPPGIGWGYGVSLQRNGDFDSGFGQLEYQGVHGRYALEAEQFDGDSRSRVRASGALVAVGGRVFATPPIESGFALVRVPGLAGVPILRENLEVGRTDARGDLLVRDLLPFYANRIALEEAAVPAGYDLRTPRRDVQVPRNTAALVILDAPAVHAITGRFVYAGAAAGDRVRVDAQAPAQPLGSGGLFYLEGLQAGRHALRVEGPDGARECVLDVPAAHAPGVSDLGVIECGGAP